MPNPLLKYLTKSPQTISQEKNPLLKYSTKTSTPAFTGQPRFSFLQESLIKPAKTFYGGILKASAETADLLDFYSDKISKKLGRPETKNSIFEYLRDNWATYGARLQKEGVSNKLAKELYSGLGQATFEVPKLMAGGVALKGATLPTFGALSGFKEGGVKGAVAGGVSGAAMGGAIKGLKLLPAKLKYPTAFFTGAAMTPGGIEEKVAGGGIFTGLAMGKSPTMKQFKETQKYSPLVKAYQKVLPFEKREAMYQNFVNRFQSIENIVQKAQSLGAKIKPGEDPMLRARGYLGIGRKVQSVLEDKTYRITPDGKIEITGEGLKPILDNYDKSSPVKNRSIREKDLADYLIARRTVKDLQRSKFPGEPKKGKIVSIKQVREAHQRLKNINQRYGGNVKHLEQTANRLYEYQKRVLHLLVDSGNLSQQQYDTILSQNRNYIPFDRVMEGIEPTGGTPISKRRFTGARAPVKRIRGSEREIRNPIESVIKNTYRIMDSAERNIVAKGVTQLGKTLPEDISPVKMKMQPVKVTAKEAGEEKVLFRPSQFKPKGNIIEVFENGKRKYYEVTPNLYQAMTGLNESSVNLLTQVMSKPAHWLRVGATITPEFMFRNPIRDQLTALMQTNFGFKPFVDSTGAVADIVGRQDIYYDWLRSGGAYSGFVELTRPRMQQMLKDLQKKPDLLKSLNIINHAQDLSQLFEQATRVGVYKAGIKKGLAPLQAGFQSREATVDFARRGAKTKDINAMIAFFNAGIQGTDKSIRTAMADPAGFATKGIATITIPSLLLYLKNRNDPDFKEIPRWQRDLFWVTKVGETYVRIPKPFLYGQVFGSVPERFFEYLDTQDPNAFTELHKSLYDAVLPTAGDPAGGILATGIKPLIENKTNWRFFMERPIIPEGKKRLLPEEQYTRYTSETAKLAGKVLNYSPAKIENLIRGWFGGTGRYALEAGDIGIKTIRKFTGQPMEPERPGELADIPLIKGFVSRPPEAQSESVNRFYENRNKIIAAYSSIQQNLKIGNQVEAQKLIKQYPEYKYYKAVNKASQLLSNLNKYSDIIIKSDRPEKEKRQLLKKIDLQKVEIARKANEWMSKRNEFQTKERFNPLLKYKTK